MKKIYRMLLVALMSLVGTMAASAQFGGGTNVEFTLNVDDATRVPRAMKGFSSVTPLQTGDNTLSGSPTSILSNTYTIFAEENCYITKITFEDETLAENVTQYALLIEERFQGKTVYLTSAAGAVPEEGGTEQPGGGDSWDDWGSTEEPEDPVGVDNNTITVKADDWNSVKVFYLTENPMSGMLGGLISLPKVETELTLTGSETKLALENSVTTIYVQARDGVNITECKKNGVDASWDDAYSAYGIEVEKDMTIEVKTSAVGNPEIGGGEEPAESYSVKFTYADDESRNFIETVAVNYSAVDNYNSDDFTVPAGATVTISVNTAYEKDSFTINGVEGFLNPLFNNIEFTVNEATVVYVQAHKPGNVTFTVKVDNPDNITVSYGSGWFPTQLAPTGPETVFEVGPTVTSINVQSLGDGVSITECTVDGAPASLNLYGTAYQIPVKNGMVVDVKTHVATRDQNLLVYIDGNDLNMFSLINKNYNMVFSYYEGEGDFVLGQYNHYMYSPEMDCPFEMSAYYTGGSPAIYINNVKDETIALSSTDFDARDLYFEGNTVVKVYLGGEPEEYDVTFEDEYELAEVTMDRFTPVDHTASLKALHGTEVAVKAAEGKAIHSVTVDGAAVEADADGAYVFQAKGHHKVVISPDPSTLVKDMAAEQGVLEVYNLQGIRLHGVSATEFNTLPRGIYIVNGKKIAIR